MANVSEEEKKGNGNVFQRLLCVFDVCGLRCSLQTRNLKDQPNEMTQRPSINCFKCPNSYSMNWRKLKFGGHIFLNLLLALCGLAISIAVGILKLFQTPRFEQSCRYSSMTGSYRYSENKRCWYDLLDRSISIEWSVADYLLLSSGSLIFFFAIISIIVISIKKRDYVIFTGLLFICAIIHGTGLGMLQLRDKYNSGYVGGKEESNLVSSLRHSIERTKIHEIFNAKEKDTWESIQKNCECCGIFSYKDWETVPPSCSQTLRYRNCFGYTLDDESSYNFYKKNITTAAKHRPGCLPHFVRAMTENIIHSRRNFTPFFAFALVAIGILIFLRGCMFIPFTCIEKKKPADTEPLLLECSDIEILKP